MPTVLQDPPVALPTDSGVVVVVDPVHADALWPEFAYHGEAHDHGDGGVMVMPAGLGFPVDDTTHYARVSGSMHQTDEVALRFGHLDTHDTEPVRGSVETRTPWTSDVAWAGDPVSLPGADNEPSRLTSWRWPASAGIVAVRVLLNAADLPVGAVLHWSAR